jgi:hypothetical protein
MEGCPIKKDANYGYFAQNAIKIGGGKDYGYQRIESYLASLLGPRGEIITYSENKSVTYKGVEISVFSILVGKDYKTLYFDTSNFEELGVLHGFKCSAPLPGKPDNGSFSS